MGLKVTRSAESGRMIRALAHSLRTSGSDMSSLISARNLYLTVAENGAAPQRVPAELTVRPDGKGHLGSDLTEQLFNRVWELVRADRALELSLDMSQVYSVDKRFLREIGFLRRHLHRQNRQLRLSNVRPECTKLSNLK